MDIFHRFIITCGKIKIKSSSQYQRDKKDYDYIRKDHFVKNGVQIGKSVENFHNFTPVTRSDKLISLGIYVYMSVLLYHSNGFCEREYKNIDIG
ncbi:hypothetical protein Cst_c10370 [Thermoclostridium stercorarium subsp. stercorarium DSM 8532]|uniref:Uncharacterized protein n=1 Tax=Thermoclostridium stercorarium (strain ATCC 35414 / DSM 8532 / NCIMB 11754) TaxID=1121335 RepID=L7VIX6_THES1|nr:hypothetical protein Cst_c10370 [Thermoclostridium stercorarium subsp. stercorarium DSM 8532]